MNDKCVAFIPLLIKVYFLIKLIGRDSCYASIAQKAFYKFSCEFAAW